MRKLALALPVAFALAGCATTGGGGLNVGSIIAATQTACSFVPTVETVANILAASPALATAEAVADLICGAVTSTKSARLRSAGPVTVTALVNGKRVTISGTFQ